MHDELQDDPALFEDVDLSRDEKRQILRAERDIERATHWELLKLSASSKDSDIKRAYFVASKMYHPDRYYGRAIGSYEGRLERIFKARRDKLTEEAEKFYYYMAAQVDVQCSNQSEIVVVERFEGNEVEVSVAVDRGNETPAEPYYHRRFKGEETKEVRIYLHGGNTRVVTRGNKGGGPKIRVIGGPANDVVDTSQGGKVDFHDFEGNNHAREG